MTQSCYVLTTNVCVGLQIIKIDCSFAGLEEIREMCMQGGGYLRAPRSSAILVFRAPGYRTDQSETLINILLHLLHFVKLLFFKVLQLFFHLVPRLYIRLVLKVPS